MTQKDVLLLHRCHVPQQRLALIQTWRCEVKSLKIAPRAIQHFSLCFHAAVLTTAPHTHLRLLDSLQWSLAPCLWCPAWDACCGFKAQNKLASICFPVAGVCSALQNGPRSLRLFVCLEHAASLTACFTMLSNTASSVRI